MKALVLIFALGLNLNIAQAISPFVVVPSEYNQEKDHLEVTNMPPVTDQAGLGVCYAHIATTVLQAEHCRQNNLDCTSLDPSQLISPLDMTRFQMESIARGYDKNGNGLIKEDPSTSDFQTMYLVEDTSS